METTNKNKFNIDHVYCHSNTTTYIRGNPEPTDILSILKENKQLKAMLLLHLDLIQEQSDQLMSKEKEISTLREENEALKTRFERMDRRLQNKCFKLEETSETQNNDLTEKKPLSSDNTSTSSIVTFCDKSEISNISSLTTESKESKYKICGDNFFENNIIGQNNGKLISKIILQRVSTTPRQSEKNNECTNMEKKSNVYIDTTTSEASTHKGPGSQDTEDDSFSCGSGDPDLGNSSQQKVHKCLKHCGMITTKHLYCSREWNLDKLVDEEFDKGGNHFKSDNYILEIPKWTVKDYTGLYSIEGTEDLSDETFLKRHAKLEHDEKRRKKWDVQRIREQRTIERLKKRHYKDELQEVDSSPEITSFYPSAESVKFIQITEDLPVLAFGEVIPKIPPVEFMLPWKKNDRSYSDGPDESKQTRFIFLKKRKKQCPQTCSRRVHRRPPLRSYKD